MPEEEIKILPEQNSNSRMSKIKRNLGGYATAYAGVYLLQHGLDPSLSKFDNARTAVLGAIGSVALVKNRVLSFSRNTLENIITQVND